MRRSLAAPLAGAALLSLLVAPAEAARVAATDTNLYDNRFEPFELTVAPGEAVEVANTGNDRHTFTSVQGAWQEVDLAPGEQRSVAAPQEAGDYRFYCRYHASPQAEPGKGMAGVLHVQASMAGAPKPTPTGPELAFLALGAALLLARRGRPVQQAL